jgi:DtxR family transcriptional regulator, Mn-dependent transcriptional regulator
MRKQIVSSTAEDYLKVVLKFEDRSEKASTSKVARHLEVTDSTVTDMLRKLQAAGLLEYKPYYGAALTAKGRAIALKILRRHRLIELFLHEVMGYGWEQVHDEAERLEHAVSDCFVDRIDALLNHPVKDPHGETIPDSRGFRPAEDGISLADAEIGRYTIQKVVDSVPELLAYLETEGILPTRSLSLLERAPFQGPLKLMVDGHDAPIYIGLDVAKRIFVFSFDRKGASSRSAEMAETKKKTTSMAKRPRSRHR